MRNSKNAFHLAIPCKELEETEDFYVKLGAKLARKYDDRVTFNFYGDQIVCHLSPDKVDDSPKMYPRHAGITFYNLEDYNAILDLAKKNDLKFFKDNFIRFKGRQEEHQTFFLVDPSNNLLEFKYYNDSSMMF